MAPIVALILLHGNRDEFVRLAAVFPLGRQAPILVGAGPLVHVAAFLEKVLRKLGIRKGLEPGANQGRDIRLVSHWAIIPIRDRATNPMRPIVHRPNRSPTTSTTTTA